MSVEIRACGCVTPSTPEPTGTEIVLKSSGHCGHGFSEWFTVPTPMTVLEFASLILGRLVDDFADKPSTYIPHIDGYYFAYKGDDPKGLSVVGIQVKGPGSLDLVWDLCPNSESFHSRKDMGTWAIDGFLNTVRGDDDGNPGLHIVVID